MNPSVGECAVFAWVWLTVRRPPIVPIVGLPLPGCHPCAFATVVKSMSVVFETVREMAVGDTVREMAVGPCAKWLWVSLGSFWGEVLGHFVFVFEFIGESSSFNLFAARSLISKHRLR